MPSTNERLKRLESAVGAKQDNCANCGRRIYCVELDEQNQPCCAHCGAVVELPAGPMNIYDFSVVKKKFIGVSFADL